MIPAHRRYAYLRPLTNRFSHFITNLRSPAYAQNHVLPIIAYFNEVLIVKADRRVFLLNDFHACTSLVQERLQKLLPNPNIIGSPS